ncbi:MAG: ROK family protein [Dysgonomonas sp.]
MRIGVDLGGTNVRMAIVSDGVILKKISEPCKADKPEKETLDHIIGMLRQLFNSNIRGIGVGVPSVVDAERGIVYNAANIPSWKEVHLKEIIEQEFGVPVIVNNDCNCFAFGERYFGEGTSFRNLVCVAIGTGVGAGIIINNELYGGNNTGAGEIGSLPYLNSDYEHYCSGQFFKEIGVKGDEIYQRALDGDKASLQIWGEFGKHLGNLMNVVLYTYDPQAIIIGGGIAQAFDLFSKDMYESMSKFPYPETVRRIKILLSNKSDINLLGAAALVS